MPTSTRKVWRRRSLTKGATSGRAMCPRLLRQTCGARTIVMLRRTRRRPVGACKRLRRAARCHSKTRSGDTRAKRLDEATRRIAEQCKDGRLKGTFRIKNGDSSSFIAVRAEKPDKPMQDPPSYPTNGDGVGDHSAALAGGAGLGHGARAMRETPGLTGQILLYRSEDGRTRLDVRLENGTVWLNQRQLTELFGKAKGTISEHVKRIGARGFPEIG